MPSRRRNAGRGRARQRRLPEQDTEDWEAVLYFLLHLVPVDAVSRLKHQLRKWSILEKKASPEAEEQRSPEVTAIGRLLSLYLDMHDAKFEGSEGVATAEELKELFQSEDAFARACPGQLGARTLATTCPGAGCGRFCVSAV